ncbi:hypothetical protein COT97_01465 [Candidatus Falkowbacteria bacterium CG10_big_fil_rev_8_21_14_0_10_39_11]|uniref:Uncharacterized protein n=1 Tax=Candidatus Falkowbacteria bacterium CG10_big_fil_rev_8_21_14_0_10_39_11 TaxID=1974565 RepID=A0A2H0V5S1_9BACT|nr:MAG: hypothetical protein COT97_01465 [Candidatus Falkowbacteria bacterium CG10_big_fil_rev_8_21_14_0_10_39_11]
MAFEAPMMFGPKPEKSSTIDELKQQERDLQNELDQIHADLKSQQDHGSSQDTYLMTSDRAGRKGKELQAVRIKIRKLEAPIKLPELNKKKAKLMDTIEELETELRNMADLESDAAFLNNDKQQRFRKQLKDIEVKIKKYQI